MSAQYQRYCGIIESGRGNARTMPPRLRQHISFIERRVAAVYRDGLRHVWGRKQYGIKVNPINAIPRESDFIARYRFPKVIMLRIADGFGKSPFWEKKTDPQKPCCKKYVNAQWVACIGIRYLATGASLQLLCDVQGRCCKATLTTNINRFINYLAVMAGATIKFPMDQESLFNLEEKLSQRYGIAGAVAFADGTFVPMICPVVNEKAFYCRKHYHALNVLLICDADMRILAVEAGFGGAHADSTVFQSSDIGKEIAAGGLGDYYIIGDCGYSLTEYMITPFRQSQLDERRTKARLAFQDKMGGARSCVEQLNAQLKGRWRVLSKYGSGLIMREPGKVETIVHACCYLHNLCIDEGLTPITRETQADPDMEQLLRQNSLIFLLNSVKRNQYNVAKANYRRQPLAEYTRGAAKREQILREQFGEKGVYLGRVTKRKRGRPVGSTNAARRARQAAGQQ